jgi:hypothetical protein
MFPKEIINVAPAHHIDDAGCKKANGSWLSSVMKKKLKGCRVVALRYSHFAMVLHQRCIIRNDRMAHNTEATFQTHCVLLNNPTD